MDKTRKPLLVGELNPYGADPKLALWPMPPSASGGRLCKILGVSTKEYLASFRRVNLCVGEWSDSRARQRAVLILVEELSAVVVPRLVLLGKKVCHAFYVPFIPFVTVESLVGVDLDRLRVAVLPHPSGRSRLWNDANAKYKARLAVARLWSED